jgi:predicted nuclease of predicted toxin-antitoxin system
MFFPKDKLKFLLDENIPKAIKRLLMQEGYNVREIPIGLTDKQLSEIAKSDSRVILTFDKHFLNKRLFPPKEHFGIVVFKISPPLIDTIFSLIFKLLKQIRPSEFKGRLFVVSLFRFISYPDNLFK